MHTDSAFDIASTSPHCVLPQLQKSLTEAEQNRTSLSAEVTSTQEAVAQAQKSVLDKEATIEELTAKVDTEIKFHIQ